tara:strand:+ start:2740 stop:3828 length:1089 start_codon:yes stop_codon:yes gene_type:complete
MSSNISEILQDGELIHKSANIPDLTKTEYGEIYELLKSNKDLCKYNNEQIASFDQYLVPLNDNENIKINYTNKNYIKIKNVYKVPYIVIDTKISKFNDNYIKNMNFHIDYIFDTKNEKCIAFSLIKFFIKENVEIVELTLLCSSFNAVKFKNEKCGIYLLNHIYSMTMNKKIILMIQPIGKELNQYYIKWKRPINYKEDDLELFAGYFLYGDLSLIKTKNIHIYCPNVKIIDTVIKEIVENLNDINTQNIKDDLSKATRPNDKKALLNEWIKSYEQELKLRNLKGKSKKTQLTNLVDKIRFFTPDEAIEYLEELNQDKTKSGGVRRIFKNHNINKLNKSKKKKKKTKNKNKIGKKIKSKKKN